MPDPPIILSCKAKTLSSFTTRLISLKQLYSHTQLKVMVYIYNMWISMIINNDLRLDIVDLPDQLLCEHSDASAMQTFLPTSFT